MNLITTSELKSLTRDRLAEMARELEIEGRSSMNKDQLVSAIGKTQAASPAKPAAAPRDQRPPVGSKSAANGRNKQAGGKASSPEKTEGVDSASRVRKASRTTPLTAEKKTGKSHTARPSAAKSPTPAGKTTRRKPSSATALGQTTARKVPPQSKASAEKSPRSSTAGLRSAAAKSSSPVESGGAGKSKAAKESSAKVKKQPKRAESGSARHIGGSRSRANLANDPARTAASPKAVSLQRPAAPKAASPPVAAAVPVSAKSKRIREEMRRRSLQAMQNKDLSTGILVAGSAIRGGTGHSDSSPHKDRITLIVRDSYWLQADWEITRAAVDRVRVAMNEKWHKALPVLRLMAVGDASSNRAEQLVRDIPIHGGVNNWYIDVDQPPARFRVLIGYLAETDRFFPLCRSNIVGTPKPDAVNRLDRHWRDIAEDYERIYSLSGGYDPSSGDELKELFEERLQRTMPARAEDGSSSDTDAALDRHRALPFEVDAELIVFGSTTPGATVLLSGEPVKLREDGTFTVRVALPDKRQVLPVIAQSKDSMKQRTTVIAVERNTKVMEAVDRDQVF